jgi:hypothetical protein
MFKNCIYYYGHSTISVRAIEIIFIHGMTYTCMCMCVEII